jgi:hypothetical protein
MEKVSDFFSELKERISNPLVLSFLISWCIWNYKIVVGIAFYKQNELKSDGYNSYLDLIHKEDNLKHFLWFPLVFAICYTIFFPLIKIGILAIGAAADTWGVKLNLWITKSYNVPIEVYLNQEEKYNKALDRVAKYATAEKELNVKISELESNRITLIDAIELSKHDHQAELAERDADLLSVNKELEMWKFINSNTFFSGQWYVSRRVQGTSSYNEEYNASFEGNRVELVQSNQTRRSLTIDYVISNFEHMKVQFNQNLLNINDKNWGFWDLHTLNGDRNKLTGIDGDGYNVELRRHVKIIAPTEA